MMTATKDRRYNGHKNWDYWNVSLWINNDYGLYQSALDCVRVSATKTLAAHRLLDDLHGMGVHKTPDGARYTMPNIRAAMSEMQ